MRIFLFLVCLAACKCYGQELYVFSEPASNMPKNSVSVKQTARLLNSVMNQRIEARHTTELMFGVSKNLMLHASGSFSNMYSPSQRFESVRVYGKYRFYSDDDLYRHFRMAFFADASHSRNPAVFDELGLDGDQSGVQAGFIATQLLHKLAVSATVSWTEILQESRWNKTYPRTHPYSAFSYSLSAGYLILPKSYTDYKQTNLNLYLELMGQHTTGLKRFYTDIAPAMQLIFNSQAKLNIGYRFQMGSDMRRMAEKSWLLSFEWLFLDALR